MKTILSRRTWLRLLTVTALAPAITWALPPAKGKTILTVRGQIGATNQGPLAVLDLNTLESLPQKTFTTHTPWDKEPVKFTGPLLRDVLQLVQARGQQIKAEALNDYRILIPMSDAQKYDVIVAHRINDASIPVRTKGPLFIVYPFDRLPELNSQKYYDRSIWQLKALEIE